ncbi:hypothetical protein BaRGS_00024899 [Batillaria attramentaria]|uniref:Neurotransmitter-gated ion-channel transmembrane domain-containing protein n=1 Tax=Batillaria attramentaria TaxID=370345 RepID=A0ABD0K9Y0_9CAEN
MELAEFPFDIQDISVLVTSELKEEEVELVEDEHLLSVVDTHTFSDEQEWMLHNYVTTEPKTLLETEFTQFTHSKPGLFFKCCAERRSGFFVWNIMFVMSVISALSLVTFAVDRALPQNRIQLSFILVLAGVTFKFVASQAVPRISYLTHLDRYILTLMIFLFLVAVWHGVVTLFDYSNDLQKTMDFWAFIGFIILFVLIVIISVVFMSIKGYKRRSDVLQNEQDYLVRIQC